MQFTLSGIFVKQSVYENAAVSGGNFYVFDPDAGRILGVTPIISGGPLKVTASATHTSRSGYFVVTDCAGYLGESREFEFAPPTELVSYVDFDAEMKAELSRWSGGQAVIDDGTFESLSYSGFASVVSGNWSPWIGTIYSGLVIQSGIMDGSIFLGISYSGGGESYHYGVKPTGTLVSGITHGRALGLFILPAGGFNTTADFANVGIALRAGDSPTSSTYKLENRIMSENYEFLVVSGQAGHVHPLSINCQTLARYVEDYSSTSNRTPYMLRWLCLDWETLSGAAGEASPVIINASFTRYQAGDTPAIAQGRLTPFYQIMETNVPANLFSVPPLYSITLSQFSNAVVGMDNLNLFRLSSPPSTCFSEEITPVTGTLARNVVKTVLLGQSSYTPQGALSVETASAMYSSEKNYIVTPSSGMYGQYGKGYAHCFMTDGYGYQSSLIYRFKKTVANPITAGTFRIASVGMWGAYQRNGWAFHFMRQSSNIITSDGYTLQYTCNSSSSNNSKIELFKGRYFDTLNNENTTFASPTSLASVTLSGGYEDHRKNWIEVQWKQIGANMKIEVYKKTIDYSGTTYDTSPGNVDYSWTKIIDYLDYNSPILTTTQPCYLTLLSRQNSYMLIDRIELRRIMS